MSKFQEKFTIGGHIVCGDFKGYSVDDYDNLRPGDFFDILHGFTDEDNRRLEIVRFLAQGGAKEESCQILFHIKLLG